MTFELAGTEVSADVDFRMLEIAETVFNASADMIVSSHLVNPAFVKRSLVARSIAEWVQPSLPAGVKLADAINEIAMAEPKVFGAFAGKLQGALAYSLQYISETDFDKIATKEPDTGKKNGSSGDATE